MLAGVDIGGTKCAVCLGTQQGEILEKTAFATTSLEETLGEIFRALQAFRGQFTVIGISCGGPLDEGKGIILSPPNLPGWDRVPITDMLTREFGVPAAIRNDANACALAEWRYGAGGGTENMVFLTFGTGLGAGLILNGRLYSGANGFAGEVGHLRLSDFGPAGYGKPGSFEGFCSGGGLAELGRTMARACLQRGETPAWCPDGNLDAVTPPVMAQAARAGDPDAQAVFRMCGNRLGQGLALIVDILNPQRIVIGSIFARCQDLIAPAMYETLQKEALPQALAVCEIVPAALGESIGDVAALAVAAEIERRPG